MDWGPRKAELDRLHRSVKVRRVRSLVGRWLIDAMRPPRVAAPAPLPAIGPGQLAVTFGGHASVLLRTAGLTIAFDPMLGRWAGGAHRALASALTPGHMAAVGLVLISHAHRDHLHLPSLEAVPREATVIVPSGAASALSPFGFARVVELQPGAELVTDGVKVTATPLDHGRDSLARAIGYLVEGDGPSVFLCGDAGYSPAFAQVGARHAPDVALLPIGGFLPWSFRARHLSPLDALYALEDLGARLMIPIHHGAFALSYERLDEPERWLRALVEERGLTAHVRFLPTGGSEVFAMPEAARAAGSEATQVAPVVAAASAAPVVTPTPAATPTPAPVAPAITAPSPAIAPRPPTMPGLAARSATAPVPPWGPAPSSAALAVPSFEATALVPPAAPPAAAPAPSLLTTATPPAAVAPAVARTSTPVAPMTPPAPRGLEPFDDETVVEPSPGSKLGGNWPRLPR